MGLSLSLSTNPLINRVTDLAELVRVCAQDVAISRIQLTNEFINPAWPADVIHRLVRQFDTAAASHGVSATSLMTGAQARLAAMGHPDADVRSWYENWFVEFGRIAADLGAPSIGSQFGILSYSDYDDPEIREARTDAILEGWCRIWEAVEPLGLRFLFWEQMSIGREFGHTIASTQKLMDKIRTRGIPLRLLYDVDHGDVSSPDSHDTDPRSLAFCLWPGVSDHPRQAEQRKQGRPLAVRRTVQQQWAHPAGGDRRHAEAAGAGGLRNLP